MTVSWFPHSILSNSGKLGLTHSPGAPFGKPKATRDSDLQDLKDEDVHHLICLQEKHEFGTRHNDTFSQRKEAVINHGISFTHEPIVDFSIPSLEQTHTLMIFIKEKLSILENVAIHCYAGLGRTGTIAACYLIEMGYSAHEAIDITRWTRPGTIQSSEQAEFVLNYKPLAQ